jgi:hypothetical protein
MASSLLRSIVGGAALVGGIRLLLPLMDIFPVNCTGTGAADCGTEATVEVTAPIGPYYVGDTIPITVGVRNQNNGAYIACEIINGDLDYVHPDGTPIAIATGATYSGNTLTTYGPFNYVVQEEDCPTLTATATLLGDIRCVDDGYGSANLEGSLQISCSAATLYQRIYGIPIEIDDNGTETVRELLVGPVGSAP